MSVIGPRPGLWNQDILTAERDKYNANDVKPGLTGWAQINGRDELEIPDKARERVWKVLRPYRMKLLRLAPAKFIHFGTTREILELMSGGVDEYRELGWSRLIGSSIKDSDTAGYNSVLSSRADISKDCYLEVSYVHGEAKVPYRDQ